tara:strand:+ start:185 stop:1063 length:879 start_codon:yes stop_codon:yes gene_type:complete
MNQEITMNLPELPSQSNVQKMFDKACKKMKLTDKEKSAISDLAIYELTDGTRTTTDLKGWETYFDGGLFVMRLFYLLSQLGVKHSYVLTTGFKHQSRENYNEIIKALEKEVEVYHEFATKNNIKLKFVLDKKSLKKVKGFLPALTKLEKETKNNTGITMYILINYDSDWAYKDKSFKKLPNANVIIKHTKGQINEGLWLPGKLHGNGFVYAQNGSMNQIWSDMDLIYLITCCLRSMTQHQGMQYASAYQGNEDQVIRHQREDKLYMIKKKFKFRPKKRVVLFSKYGPEIYEF